ncbi:hypothetical protein NDU88_008828 [Pleurodeles waltl]|uniref:Uncharacterized protein n=1 Tax=Pleurodeles waltl TaxID=8319 RepID=A0AAV7NX91_PLEWA|nr:hypothetical protein NDU88_008828 [Pleurodeles waltl]
MRPSLRTHAAEPSSPSVGYPSPLRRHRDHRQQPQDSAQLQRSTRFPDYGAPERALHGLSRPLMPQQPRGVAAASTALFAAPPGSAAECQLLQVGSCVRGRPVALRGRLSG